MLNKVKKIIVCAFALVLCIMNVGQVNVLANTDDINEELKGYDLTACENAKTSSLITFSELGFGTDDYSLIAYVYNYDKKPLNLNTGSNVINMACRFIVDDKTNEYVPVEYSNFNLKYLSKTSDNLIYKFSVVDKDKILKNLFTYQNAIYGERTYAITGIQLIDIYSNLAKDYNVGRKFIYSGYENDKTLKHSLKTVETIELKVNYVWYRTDSSSKGKNYQNQLNSVYFSVPNRYFDEGY
ncbi:MAG: hypothetical protein IKT32_03620, partial [Clostridia bacterium]|nr:hypothetical protein [Clostridia bacterium]